MKKDLKVSSDEQALKLMRSFLAANMLDNDLEVKDEKAETPQYIIKYGWLAKGKRKLGCPCYVANYHGYIPGYDKSAYAIVFVKSFAQKEPTMTKMQVMSENISFLEIKDNEPFMMDDGRQYVRKNGHISEI